MSEGAAAAAVPGSAAVTVRISGGLGNQMFQYAAARALALRCGAGLCLDTRFFDAGRHRSYALAGLPLAAHRRLAALTGPAPRLRMALQRQWELISGRRTPLWEEPHFHYSAELERQQAPVYLRGHFQSWRYFEPCASEIRAELMPAAPGDPESQRLASEGGRSAALHVRRGDYLSAKNIKIYAQPGVTYYQAALAQLPAGTPVWVFSDDIAWCRANLQVPPSVPPLHFVDTDGASPRSALADLWLMAQAQHHIIANSSLSWWAAWLADGRGGQKFAPRQWFVDARVSTADLLPAHWQRL
jgi:hypothetical protein